MKYVLRKRFAWKPITIYRLNGHFVEPVKKLWLKNVIEMETVWKTWIAYEKMQND